MRELAPTLFGYIWRHSRRDQLAICAVVLGSLPFYFASLDLPRRIVNDAITGKAFKEGQPTTSFLDLTIHWPAWTGGGTTTLFEGFRVGQLELLLGLSTIFLGLVLINGAFKYWINLAKGVLGERMLRRLRFDLFALMLRFTPEAMREVKASETATIIKDEVEPIGAFIGDAFVVPAFLGTQAATALFFILLQNVWLGLAAGSMVAVQLVVIPRLRRVILRLSRERQLASRMFAGRIAEVLDGLEAVTLNDAARWERAEIGGRLHRLFDLRLKIYKRKFLVKYLNNLLAQVTPFLFYAIGGAFALKGELNVGQLVAVLAAYRDLPPPLKELIDWDQQRLDVEVKYETVAAHFAPQRLRSDEAEGAEAAPLGGPLAAEGLVLRDLQGGGTQEIGSFSLPLPARVALVSPGRPQARLLARTLAGLQAPQAGSLTVGGADVATLPLATRARRIGYAGPEPTLFPGSIRDNVVYGLHRRPVRAGRHAAGEHGIEARRTGNPTDSIGDEWIDYAALGLADADALDARIIALLVGLGMGADLDRFGLAALSTVSHDSPLGERVIAARRHLQARFAETGRAGLVIPFDLRRYNEQATVAENLLFGVPRVPELVGRRLAGEPRFRATLARLGLLDDLTAVGVAIARNMIEIFRDVHVGHALWRRFSVLAPEELPDYERRLADLGDGAVGSLSPADAEAFLALALPYVEPRQRLGLIDPILRNRIVGVREPLREALCGPHCNDIDPFDPNLISPLSSVLDNLLFGRINVARMHGEAEVQVEVLAAVRRFGLEAAIRRRGLDHAVGTRGRLLGSRQQVIVTLARAIVRRPEILVLDGVLEQLDLPVPALLDIFPGGDPAASLVAAVVREGDAEAFPVNVRLGAAGGAQVVAREQREAAAE
ncbi:ABC transporter transmembrane domain-containing protein [Methylobacterium sp. A54F]